MLGRTFEYLEKVIPMSAEHWLISVLLGSLTFLFPAPSGVYQAFVLLVALDTFTGIVAAIRNKTFSSRVWKNKLMSKILGYMFIPTALYTFGSFLVDTPLNTMFDLAARFTLASIAFIELSSILENAGAILGKRVTLRFDPKDLKDLLESNHVNTSDNGDRGVQ